MLPYKKKKLEIRRGNNARYNKFQFVVGGGGGGGQIMVNIISFLHEIITNITFIIYNMTSVVVGKKLYVVANYD